MNLNFLPNKKVRSKIYLKFFIGIFAAGIIFAFSILIYLGAVSISLGDIEIWGLSNYQFLVIVSTIIVVSILYTLFFSYIPSVFGGLLLLVILYKDFRNGAASKRNAILKGMSVGGATALVVSIFAIFYMSRPAERFMYLPHAILVILIGSLVGIWGGIQVYEEIETEYSEYRKEDNK